MESDEIGRSDSMLRIAIVLGSTRPGRRGKAVADWAYDQAAQRADARFELIDVADYGLPLLDEPRPAALEQYRHDHTKAWSAIEL